MALGNSRLCLQIQMELGALPLASGYNALLGQRSGEQVGDRPRISLAGSVDYG
jgi:hypothetical protein